jgi:hypothetical protein
MRVLDVDTLIVVVVDDDDGIAADTIVDVEGMPVAGVIIIIIVVVAVVVVVVDVAADIIVVVVVVVVVVVIVITGFLPSFDFFPDIVLLRLLVCMLGLFVDMVSALVGVVCSYDNAAL